MKHCNSCKKDKDKSCFGKRSASKDGLAAKCKECQSEYDKKRASLPHRVAARKKYSLTDEGKAAGGRAKQKYRKENPQKYKAHNIVSNAIRDKKLFREPCEVCGITDVHAHHDDYAKPLNVRWLCAPHHSQWHKKNGEGKNA